MRRYPTSSGLALVVVLVGCPTDVGIGDGNDPDLVGCTEACDRAQIFTQISKVDVLVALDNSVSMSEEHQRLASGFEDLLERTVGEHHDLHLGVVATELDDPEHGGRLIEVDGVTFTSGSDIVAANTWIEEALFAVGLNESNLEKARAVLQEALTTHAAGANAGFRRDDAHLAVLILTDEDDATGPMPSIDSFVSWLDERWGLPSVTVHAIVGEAYDFETGCAGGYGSEHLQLVEITGGTELSVCEPDYGPFLAALGQLVVIEGLATRFTIGEEVAEGSLAVEVRYPSGFLDLLDVTDFAWSAEELAVVVDTPPPAGSVVEIRYSVP